MDSHDTRTRSPEAVAIILDYVADWMSLHPDEVGRMRFTINFARHRIVVCFRDRPCSGVMIEMPAPHCVTCASRQGVAIHEALDRGAFLSRIGAGAPVG